MKKTFENKFLVLVDWQNIFKASQERINIVNFTQNLKTIFENRGRLQELAIYNDWGRAVENNFIKSNDKLRLETMGWVCRDVVMKRSGHDKTDSHLIVDACEHLWKTPDLANNFVICSGDADYMYLSRKIRTYGKKVIIVSFAHALARSLESHADEVIMVDKLVEVPEKIDLKLKKFLFLLSIAYKKMKSRPGGFLGVTKFRDDFYEGNPHFFKKYLQQLKDMRIIKIEKIHRPESAFGISTIEIPDANELMRILNI